MNLLQLRLLKYFYWMNPTRKRNMIAWVLQAIGYTLIARSISNIINEEVGLENVGKYLAANAMLSLVIYLAVSFFGFSRKLLLWVFPVSIGILLLMGQKEWIPLLWVLFGPFVAVIYTATDGFFQQSLESTEHESWSEDTSQKRRVKTSITTSSFVYYITTALASAVGVWITGAGQHEAWIFLSVSCMVCAWIIIWRTPVEQKRKIEAPEKKGELNVKNTFQLYLVATPYLGVCIANAVIFTTAPIFLKPLDAGLVVLVSSVAYSFCYLVPMQENESTWIKRGFYLFLTIGVLLFPLGTWLSLGLVSTSLYLVGGVTIGLAVSHCKLRVKMDLYKKEAQRKERAASALNMMSELGYIVGPILIGLTAIGGPYSVWAVAAVLPLATAAAIRRK